MAEYKTGDAEIASLLQAAAKAQAEGRHSDASDALHDVLRRDPANPVALNSLGMRALAAGDAARAETLFRRAIEADSGAAPLRMNLATAQRTQGDDEGERASLLSALALDQRHLMANIRLAELHERLGESAEAMYRWNAVLAIGAMLPEVPPPLREVLEHARSTVGERNRIFAEIVEDGLSDVRGSVDARGRRRFDACVDVMLGRRRVYSNECHGLHFPFLPADEFFDRAHFPWLERLEAETDVIREELEALLVTGLDGFSPYVTMDAGTPANKWSPLDKSLDWSALHLWREGRRVDEACERCPRTAEIVERLPRAEIPGRAPTVFFSVLRPRTRIPPHTGVSNARAIIHLPLIVPPGCGFRVGGETREWQVGEAFAFDDTIEHEAWNDSDELRAVLILDTWNPYLSEAERLLLQRLFEVADASGHRPDPKAAFGDAG